MLDLGTETRCGRPTAVTTRALVLAVMLLGASATAGAQDAPAEVAPRPASERVAEPASRSGASDLGAPTAPEPSRMDAARRLASLAIDEAAIERQRGGASGERVLATSLYVGGVTIVFASVSLFVISALQGACVAEADLGCYDASEYMVGGLASGAIGAVLLSGAGFADRRAGFLEGRVREREIELEERRDLLQRRVGLALGPTSIHLRVSF